MNITNYSLELIIEFGFNIPEREIILERKLLYNDSKITTKENNRRNKNDLTFYYIYKDKN